MGKYIPVDPEKWAAMVQAQSDLPRWKEMCDELDARCNELKAEVERLTALIESNLNSSKVAMGKADAVLHERESLKAEVERLRKAGDAMASCIQFNEEMEQDYEGPTYVRKCVKDWNAAKEGKQS